MFAIAVKNGSAGFVVAYVEAAVTNNRAVDNMSDIVGLVRDETDAVAQSVQLIDRAVERWLIPAQFDQDPAFFADLANFLLDGTFTANGFGDRLSAYNSIISFIGSEIYNNRDAVLAKNYIRPNSTFDVQTLVPDFGIDRPGQAPGPIIIDNSKGNEALQRLINNFNRSYGGVDVETVGPR